MRNILRQSPVPDLPCSEHGNRNSHKEIYKQETFHALPPARNMEIKIHIKKFMAFALEFPTSSVAIVISDSAPNAANLNIRFCSKFGQIDSNLEISARAILLLWLVPNCRSNRRATFPLQHQLATDILDMHLPRVSTRLFLINQKLNRQNLNCT